LMRFSLSRRIGLGSSSECNAVSSMSLKGELRAGRQHCWLKNQLEISSKPQNSQTIPQSAITSVSHPYYKQPFKMATAAINSLSTFTALPLPVDKYRGAVVEVNAVPSLKPALQAELHNRTFNCHQRSLFPPMKPSHGLSKWHTNEISPIFRTIGHQVTFFSTEFVLHVFQWCRIQSSQLESSTFGIRRCRKFEGEVGIGRSKASAFSTPPPLTYKNPIHLVQDDNVRQYAIHFKRSSDHPYTTITPLTPLSELEEFLETNIFALGTFLSCPLLVPELAHRCTIVTDHNRKFVLAVATAQDLENFVTRRGS
jgi:hypothetical protein